MPPVKTGSAREQSLAKLELFFACPNCGAPAHADEETASVPCTHCGSLLFVVRGEAPLVGMAECVVKSDEDLQRVYVERRLAQYRAELCGDARGGDGFDAQIGVGLGRVIGDAMGGSLGGAIGGAVMAGLVGGGGTSSSPVQEPPFLQQRLAAEQKRLKEVIRVGERRLLHVPYWQHRALVVQQLLAREKGGQKIVAVRAAAAEQSSPAYADCFDMRDRGMRVGTARMRLLGPGARAEGHVFLAVQPGSAASRTELERACLLPPEDLDRLFGRGELLAERTFLVYRPVWLVQYTEKGREAWLLVEGQTGIIAGEVSSATELDLLLHAECADPFASLRPARVVIAASRCVECGRDIPHDRLAWMRACPHCRTGLGPGSDGLVRVPYEVAAGHGGETWMPAWTWRFAVRLPSGQTIVTLEDLAQVLGMPPAVKCSSGGRLWVPAVRLLGQLRGVKQFDDLCEWLHRARLAPEGGPIPPTDRSPAVACELFEPQARELARSAFMAQFDAAMTARLNVHLAREIFEAAELLLADARLVMVKIPQRIVPR